MDENTEGVNEDIVKAIVAGKKKELDAMEAFGIFDVCEELPRDAKVITTRWKKTFRRATSGDADSLSESSDMVIQISKDSTSTAPTGRLVDMHAVQRGYKNFVPRCRKCVLPCRGRRGVEYGFCYTVNRSFIVCHPLTLLGLRAL